MSPDYSRIATDGAAMCRAALAEARATREGTRAPNVAPRPPTGPVRGTPAPASDPEWTPHDAMPPIPTPGHWADGTPIADPPDDEPPPEELQ